ncbi:MULTISPECIES: ubiquitin-like domain-containing protein [Gracilibacillus]|uniref:ubiquitin-like domain-containing protein n=1 Tax=Gracilibacillus TaxID=74385 RepID=UPI000826E7D2|nr:MULTISPECIES: G5 and 3D domain-containing protein [Gracilibacillus]
MKRFSIRRFLNNTDFKLALSLFVIIGFICFSFYELSKAEVTVVQADESTSIRTHANVVEDVLDELSISIAEHDDISHSQDTLVVDGMQIEHIPAKEVTVTMDGEAQSYFTTSATVEEFLNEQGIEVDEKDNLSIALDTPIDDDLAWSIDKAFQVTINDQDMQKEVLTSPGSTIEELLVEESIELGKLDRVEPEKDALIERDQGINIVRVEKVTDVVEEKQDSKLVKRSDDSLAKGTEEVVSEGKSGIVEKHYEVVMENGEEVSRELVKEEVTQDSEDRIVAVGTMEEAPVEETEVLAAQTEEESAKQEPKQEKPESNDAKEKKQEPKSEPVTTASAEKTENVSRGGNEEEGKTLYMKATAYNWDCASCDGRGLTATGYDLKSNPEGVVAVDPNVIPLGTKVWVEGYGYAIARDTGGNIKGNKIDLHMSSPQKAASYGMKNVQVKIMD